MKKIVLFTMLSVYMMVAQANDTESRLTITDLTLNPGGESGFFYVGLEGQEGQLYSGYSMDIYLPDGIEACLDEENAYDVFFDDDDSDIYPYSKKTGYYHKIQASQLRIDGKNVLRILCVDATTNKEFEDTSGRLFYAQLKATSYAKPGDFSATIKNIALVDQIGTKYVPEEVSSKLTISTEATAPVTISSNKWSTCILPFDAELPTGVTAYSTSAKTTIDDADYLVLSKVNALEGYKPYILYSETAYSGSLEGTVDATKYPTEGYVTDGYLNGAITVQQISKGFVLQNLASEGMKFYATGGNTFSIPAGKCWVTLPSAEAKAFGFALEDETGVKPIRDLKQYENEVYDLSGKKIDIRQTRVNHIYIINGQKVLKTK